MFAPSCSYNPLSRRIFMNVLDDSESLMNTLPFIQYGLQTPEGAADVSATGYVNIPSPEKLEMIGRLHGCPTGVATINIAGSSTVQPVAEAWSESYTAICPGITFVVEGGGSSAGAGRVCGDEEDGTSVHIGTMSREWKDTEATEGDNNVVSCLIGDVTRSAIQVEVSTCRCLTPSTTVSCLTIWCFLFCLRLPLMVSLLSP
jgi:PBP superfamily domain